MPQGAAASVADRHFPLHFNGGHLVDELNGVGTVLAEFVLRVTPEKKAGRQDE
jgi:hypothetical protein